MPMTERTKRVRLNVVIDVDFVPGTEEGFGGWDRYGKHVMDLLEVDGTDYEDTESGDDFYVRVVGVELADQ